MRKHDDMSFDDYDELINPRPNETDFDRIVDRALTRRDLMKGIMVFGGVAALGSTLVPTATHAATNGFAFDAVSMSTDDSVAVPRGYRAQVMVRWGDPLWSDVPEFDHATRGTGASQARAFGDNNDGMEVYSVGDKTILIVNNEYTNKRIIWGNHDDGKAASDDDILKGMNAHGLTVTEIVETDGVWGIVKDSPFNRRVTPDVEIDIAGPAAGHSLMRTRRDPAGRVAQGTFNNCGNGSTPWGTYLACEENFNGYFATDDQAYPVSPEMKRYGISPSGRGYDWHRIDDRFDLAKTANEYNRHGFVTEVNPADPTSRPKKRTALGRFKHENAEVVVNADGRIVVYMGDDERGEFLYRYVSNGVYAPGGETDSLLDDGTLYAARFHENGTGKWLELSPATTGMTNQAEVCIHTRQAASTVGATTMDRPEWVASNPTSAEVYCCLTNNKNRGKKPNAGGDETPVGGPNPREANRFGQIVRWRPEGADHTSNDFEWDLYVLAGNPTVHQDARAGSENINEGNMFNSPDGLKFDSNGLLWIQTDGNYSNEKDYAGQGNNQMLAGDPASGEIRRFMTGPKQCEVTGLTWSPDRRTMFVGIQHPGERGEGHWPEGGDAVPRSAIVAVTREDGGVVG
ncbi:MAG: PhoX family phosphatase [Pseudomonadota bacterium]